MACSQTTQPSQGGVELRGPPHFTGVRERPASSLAVKLRQMSQPGGSRVPDCRCRPPEKATRFQVRKENANKGRRVAVIDYLQNHSRLLCHAASYANPWGGALVLCMLAPSVMRGFRAL